MSEQDTLSASLKDLTIKKEERKKTDATAKKPKAAYDVVALKERWKILGTDPEQSKACVKLLKASILTSILKQVSCL